MRSNSVLTRILLIAVAIIATYAGISSFGIGFTAASPTPAAQTTENPGIQA